MAPLVIRHAWILNHYAQEPGGAGGTRHFSLAKHLLSHDCQTTVIAASVAHNTGLQRLKPAEDSRLVTFDGVPFLWVKTPPYKGNGGGRMLNMLAYAFRVLLPRTTRELPRPDVVVGSSVHPLSAVSGAWLAKRHGVPFVFEVRDLWPQTLVDLGRLQDKSLMTRCLRWLELWLYQRADKIVVLLPNAVDYIAPLGIPADKVVWIPNGVELEGYPKPEQPVLRDDFTLMYFGAHGPANGLGCVIEAMAVLSRQPDMGRVILRLIGDGPAKSSLMTLTNRLELKNVQFENPVPKSKIPRLASEADAFVICVKDLPSLYKYGISPNKLFDYFAASRPIIIASGAANNPVLDANAGLIVEPDSPENLAKAIRKLVLLPQSDRNAMGEAGRNYVEKHHGYDSLAARFVDVFQKLGK